MKILLSSDPDKLETELKKYNRYATVEAEYGDRCVEGNMVFGTLAHHGPRKDNPCPCLAPNVSKLYTSVIEAIGVSHFDLDTLGGILALLGEKPDFYSTDGFWEFVAFVDTHGVHKIEQYKDPAGYDTTWPKQCLNAWYAWAQDHKIYAPRDGSVIDIYPHVALAAEALQRILEADVRLLHAGAEFAKKESELNKESFRFFKEHTIIRKSDRFVNHLYNPPSGEKVFKAVAALNTKTGQINISLADPIPGVSCQKIVQELWGPFAGGHDGIAGSPRNEVMTETHLLAAADALEKALSS